MASRAHCRAQRQAGLRTEMSIARAQLQRQTFTTSRLLEFCSLKELQLQTGHTADQWPLVVAKELGDNALDACEEGGVRPEVMFVVDLGEQPAITVSDNGPGIAAETITAILDYSTRTSSREAYASPTRGAQGNALKTILAMPFALSGGEEDVATIIESRGVRHTITLSV